MSDEYDDREAGEYLEMASDEAAEEIADLTRQRDALLKACKAVDAWIIDNSDLVGSAVNEETWGWIDQLREALALCPKEPPCAGEKSG